MADPYAERSDLPSEERLAPDSPLAEAARDSGARVLASLAGAAETAPADAGCAVVILSEDGLVPPLARISPELAAALLCDPDRAAVGEDAAIAVARQLLEAGDPIYLLKTGHVAGPAGSEGAYEPSIETAIAAFEAAREDRIDWERDPDFGYEVAAHVPSLEGRDADAFLPRLLYASADRVYEHAELVEVTKRRRHERLRSAGVTDEGLLAAVGWPIVATGQEWKD